jgi:uncharacterized repeat protein (TIGR01451 family)
MFEKLLSLLPYNPGLTHQMAFYSRRMREEAAIRRTGVIFLTLAFTIQFLAVLSPPQPTIANSSNDLINGGISSAAEAKRYCSNNTRHYKQIMNYYGISCKKLGSAEKVRINSADHEGKFYSMGWNPQGQTNDRTGRKTNETAVNIPGVGKKVYWRLLKSWDSPGSSSTYEALRLKNSNGKHFWILFNCGNLVTIGIPSPDLPTDEDEPTPPAPEAPAPPAPVAPPPPAPTPTPPTPTPTPCPYNSSLPLGSPLCFKPCEYNPQIPETSNECKPCDESISTTDSLACISISKAASNDTQGLADANNTTANAGDVINYTLYAKNRGKAALKNFVFAENMNDVLDYADITDLHGGTIDNTGQVTWPAETIAANSTSSHKLTIKVKTPVPQTPVSSSDPMHFDLVMTNVYGNTINVKLPGSAPKQVEAAAETLPNAGPGTTLLIAGLTVLMAGYFYSRSALLAKESNMALHEMASA